MVSGAGAGVWRTKIMPKTPVCRLACQAPAPVSGAPDTKQEFFTEILSGAPDAGAGVWPARQQTGVFGMIACCQTPAPAPDTIKQEFFTRKFKLPDGKQEFFI